MHTALVTGGTRGIGAGICLALKEAGHKVIATYHGNDVCAKEFSQKHVIPTYKWDVSNYEACVHGVLDIEKTHGVIDILVNNAGITRDSFFHKMTPAMWHEVMETNLSSLFYMTRCVIAGMRTRHFGRIVNISSINGVKGQIGQTNYCAAKAGVIGFTKALAQENAAKGITVNAIAPGYIGTEMVNAMNETILNQIIAQIPTKRLGTPEEIGEAVAFLSSPHAHFINGATLHINGGQYMM